MVKQDTKNNNTENHNEAMYVITYSLEDGAVDPAAHGLMLSVRVASSSPSVLAASRILQPSLDVQLRALPCSLVSVSGTTNALQRKVGLLVISRYQQYSHDPYSGIETLSAFPFESFHKFFRECFRSGNLQAEQIRNRCVEKSKYQLPTASCGTIIQNKLQLLLEASKNNRNMLQF